MALERHLLVYSLDLWWPNWWHRNQKQYLRWLNNKSDLKGKIQAADCESIEFRCPFRFLLKVFHWLIRQTVPDSTLKRAINLEKFLKIIDSRFKQFSILEFLTKESSHNTEYVQSELNSKAIQKKVQEGYNCLKPSNSKVQINCSFYDNSADVKETPLSLSIVPEG